MKQTKVKTIRAWAITYKDKEGEEVVGFNHLLIFRSKTKVQQEFDRNGYSPKDNRKEMSGGWRIIPVLITPLNNKPKNKKKR